MLVNLDIACAPLFSYYARQAKLRPGLSCYLKNRRCVLRSNGHQQDVPAIYITDTPTAAAAVTTVAVV